MMVARLGDQNSHGGVILTGSTDKLTNGLSTAILGSQCSCPIHGTNSIVTVQQTTVLTDGSVTAVDAAIMQCGAVIILGSQNVQAG